MNNIPDRSSAELKILGNMSLDDNFIKAYRENLDLHTLNASNIYKVPYEAVQKEQRKASKAVTFGLCISEDAELFVTSGIKKIKDISIDEIPII